MALSKKSPKRRGQTNDQERPYSDFLCSSRHSPHLPQGRHPSQPPFLAPCHLSTHLVKKAFLSHKDMELLIKGAAKGVYHLSKKDLSRFTVHSLRVGACFMLHTAGFSADDIKFELRWRSDAFRDYLRNILSLAGAKAQVSHQLRPGYCTLLIFS